ncbi:hypothetical protein MUK42_28796 [Musa troglodytarum]|uniref:Uncharacterized protein n=1 Tax=Musa troglodytarum TaxID=320322 RepID=A0A9E7F7R3_9LILI|nr:hypothetical protein MUK42_28796 [Musa troglodytarum]
MTIYLVLLHDGEVTVSAFYIGFEKSFVPKTVTLLHDLDSRTASLLSKAVCSLQRRVDRPDDKLPKQEKE